MYVELLAKSERCLEQQHSHELTVQVLWEKIRALSAREHFAVPESMSDFECLLDGDKRFRLSEMKSDDGETMVREIDEDEDDLVADEIEGLGFDREQKVTLTRFYTEDDGDEHEDEAFVPRSFNREEHHADGARTLRTKKAPAVAEKKTTRKKNTTKRK